MKNEIEKRVFLTDDQYALLLAKFGVQSKRPERQITTYYKAKDINLLPTDLRLMQTSEYAMLWLKEGNMHDVCRKEHEVLIESRYAPEIIAILEILFEVKTKWFRERIKTQFGKAAVCIDRSINYGAIFEIEISVSNEDAMPTENGKELLDAYLQELGLEETAKKIQNEKCKYYEENWRKWEYPVDEILWLHHNGGISG